MAFETHMKNQESERVRTPEEQEKELRAKMFKGLLAVGAGVLWSEGRFLERAFSIPFPLAVPNPKARGAIAN